jgi:hypothetical protein
MTNNNTLDGICDTCEGKIDYDGTTDNNIMCQGYCRRTFHFACLNLAAGKNAWKALRSCSEFLFFCEHCRKLQKNFVARRNFLEAERNLANLVEILQTATHDVDVMCRSAIASVTAAAAVKKTQPKPTADARNALSPIKTRRQRSNATSQRQKIPAVIVTSSPDEGGIKGTIPIPDDDVFSSPYLATPPPPINRKNRKTGFYGTSDAVDHIGVVEERRFFVISRIDPTTEPDSITRYITEKTGIDDVKCQLLLPIGRTIADLDFVSFKIGVNETNYQKLMTPEVWPAKILVRDFVDRRRRRNRSSAGFAKF